MAAAKARREEARARTLLRERLGARREEIEAAAQARVCAIADPREASDPAYAESLRRAVGAALEYGLSSIEVGEGSEPPVPVELLAQARVAARNAISLDTVLRRYFAGYALLGYFLIEEAGRGGLMGAQELQRLTGIQAGLFDRLLAAIGEEHARESEDRALTTGQRQVERVERLLAGEPVETMEIAYELEAHHTGIVLSGPVEADALQELARSLDRALLLVQPDERTVWAWLGGRQGTDPGEAIEQLARSAPAGCAVAFGEPGQTLAGWRRTHRQAAAALPIARRGSERIVRYADVAMLASMINDDLLLDSLHGLYLAPLKRGREQGKIARETLRAYLQAGCNVSSAAAALGVSRNTVATRLRVIEELLGRSVAASSAELEAALRLERLSEPIGPLAMR